MSEVGIVRTKVIPGLVLMQFAVATLFCACAPPRQCSVLVDCTCNCDSAVPNQVTGQGCVAEEHEGACAEWAEPKKESARTACVADCKRRHGDPNAECQLAPLPGNPAITVTSSACVVR